MDAYSIPSIQRTTANRLIRASTEFATAIQAKEHQKVSEEFEARATVPVMDPKLTAELSNAQLRIKTMSVEMGDMESTIVEQDRTIRGMKSKFKAAFGLAFDKWNGTPEALHAAIGSVPMQE